MKIFTLQCHNLLFFIYFIQKDYYFQCDNDFLKPIPVQGFCKYYDIHLRSARQDRFIALDLLTLGKLKPNNSTRTCIYAINGNMRERKICSFQLERVSAEKTRLVISQRTATHRLVYTSVDHSPETLTYSIFFHMSHVLRTYSVSFRDFRSLNANEIKQ